MKKKIKLCGIIAFAALIMVSTVFVSCGGSSLSGTFSWYDDPKYVITFEGKNFTGKLDGNDFAGTFTVKSGKITLNLIDGSSEYVWTIIDNDTIQDDENDNWKKVKEEK